MLTSIFQWLSTAIASALESLVDAFLNGLELNLSEYLRIFPLLSTIFTLLQSLAVGLIVFSGTFPSWGAYVYIAGAVLILVTIRPAQMLNLPFDMIGSFTDVLSYIRLFAVGLSGMYIAQKFNMMGMMVKDALADKCMILGFVLLILVAVAGHILNLALGFLGVLVHAVRLNTLEFSNHMGLQWAGFKFKPFSAKQNND